MRLGKVRQRAPSIGLELLSLKLHSTAVAVQQLGIPFLRYFFH